MKKIILPFLAIASLSLLSFSFLDQPDAYFKSGNRIDFLWEYQSGAKRTHGTVISSTSTSGGTTTILARSTMYDEAGASTITYNYRYFSNADSWCVDPLNYMNRLDPTDSKTKIEFEIDSLVFPYNMKAGDTLMPARAKMLTTGGSMISTNEQFTYNRKVIKQDTIKTGLGNLVAWRIESKVSVNNFTDLGQIGKFNDPFECTMTEWFNPKYGIIQFDRKEKYGSFKATIQVIK